MKNIIGEYREYLLNNQQRSENTVKAYVSDITHFITLFPNFKKLQKKDIIQYLATLKDDNAPATIMRKIASIQSLWSFLVDMGYVKVNVAENLPRPKLKQAIVECPSKEEVISIIEGSENDTFKLAVQLGAYVGLRATEACELKIEDINFDTGIAILYDTKTASTAEVAIDTITRDEIRQYCEKRGIKSGAILRTKFGHPFTERTFSRFIESNSPVNFHQFRKACASALANSEAGIHTAKNQLRHTSLNTTLRYVKTDLTHQCNMLDKMRGGI